MVINFGNTFSNQIKSSSIVADFWLIIRLVRGFKRCIVSGKYPNIVENLNVAEGCLYFRLWVIWLSSRAIVKPIKVTARAVSFRYSGIVI